MAKVRIKYIIDDKELKETQAELKKIKKQNKEVADSFGDSAKEIKKTKTSLVDLKGVIGGLGLAALATGALVAFAKLTKEINKNRKETALLTKETGAALDNITAKIRATSKVFEKDYNEVLRAANAVSQQLGITMTESMAEINEAMLRGLDINGDYLDTIREYSPFMKQAGIDFRQFNILIQKQVTEGVFSDKGIDAIKEAVISIREMTPATVDALKAVGLNTKQLIKDIESGAKTYFQVIQDIGTALEDVTDQRIKGQVLADVFRGAGEDAGEFALTLQNVGTEFIKLSDEQEKYIKNQKSLLTSTEDLSLEIIKLTKNVAPLGTAFQTFLNEAGTGTLRLLNDLINGFDNLDKATQSYKDSVSTLTFDEQIEELSNLENELSKLEQSLEKTGITFQDFFKLSNEEKKSILSKEGREDAEKNIELISAKIGVLNDLADARKKKQADINSLIDEEIKKRNELIDAEKKLLLLRAKSTQGITDIEGKGIDPLDLQSQIADQTLEIEQKLQDDLLQIRERARGIDKESEEIRLAEIEERNHGRIEFAFEIANQINEIQAGFADLKIQQIQQELTALEFSRNRELELAEQTGASKEAINQRFDAVRRELEIKQLNAEKQKGVFNIAIQTAQNIVKAFPNPILIALAVALGIAQSAIVLSQKVPEFAEGVLKFRGTGTNTSDSNLVKISDEETIVSAQNTNDYYPTLKAIHNREISPDVLNNLVMNQDTRPGTVVYDYDKLAKAVMNQTQKSINVDVNGFTEHIVKTGISIQKKQNKYKM